MMIKKILPLLALWMTTGAQAQVDTAAKASKPKIDLSGRSNDHFMIQLGALNWSGKPDTLTTAGFSKSLNIYLMLDFPFKTNPKLSMGFGPGIASDQIVFSKTHVGIKDNTTAIQFTDQSDTNHFKKTKMSTVYLEAPLEFRYSADPLTGKGLKLAFGLKIGTLMTAHTRNVKYEDKDNKTINDYVMKESSKRFFNKNRVSVMARVGLGHISVYGSYQLTALFKDGLGPVVKPFSVGITLSGL
ncbi:MAG: outer membrane beta-barrel protein [Chitinophagaceae bacterium]|nr:outer membrane beta-barrel protein [Chitinophagaceae bacterium]